ncbi:hypothetical protein D3C81_2100830 [compost metagenome]
MATPRQICHSCTSPRSIQTRINPTPRAERLSPSTIRILRSYLSASTPETALNKSDGIKASRVTRATAEAFPVTP